MRVLVGAVDFELSSAFYRDILGFDVAEHWDDPDGRGTLFRASDAGVIEVFEDTPHHPFERPRGVKVAVEVDDVDGLYERVLGAGVEVVDPVAARPWGHRTFEIRDPSGLPLVFFTPVQRSRSAARER
jgi:catechol 2,3-dioxygenase-like lactoylglutathione lyase family enzyme